MKYLALGGVALAALAGCASYVAPVRDVVATADVRDPAGLPRAVATATQQRNAIRLQVAARNMAPGTYGAHVHMTGRCEAPTFESAGGHWNPTNQMHGKENPRGVHKGDLPNLLIGADRTGRMEVTIPRATLRGASDSLLDSDGAALVIHAAADDYRTDPSGNSGARIACGVFR